MDDQEYRAEIETLRRTIERLEEVDSDPVLVSEYKAELRNLVALHEAARDAFVVGSGDPDVRRALALLGFGDWTFANVYSFVYDAAMDAELGESDLATLVAETDYAESLRASLD